LLVAVQPQHHAPIVIFTASNTPSHHQYHHLQLPSASSSLRCHRLSARSQATADRKCPSLDQPETTPSPESVYPLVRTLTMTTTRAYHLIARASLTAHSSSCLPILSSAAPATEPTSQTIACTCISVPASLSIAKVSYCTSGAHAHSIPVIVCQSSRTPPYHRFRPTVGYPIIFPLFIPFRPNSNGEADHFEPTRATTTTMSIQPLQTMNSVRAQSLVASIGVHMRNLG
jgi:hypothetical protein